MQNSMILNIVAILCIIAIKKFALILSIINRHTSNCVRVSLLIICLLISSISTPKHSHTTVSHDKYPPQSLCVFVLWSLNLSPQTHSSNRLNLLKNNLEMFCNLYVVFTVYIHIAFMN